MAFVLGGYRGPAVPVVVKTTDPSTASTVTELQGNVARLHLQMETLCRLLIAKGVVTEQELNEWLDYVDKLDGVADGKLRRNRGPRECSACGRMNSPQAPRCQYCGHEFTGQFLEKLDPKSNPGT